MCARGMLWGGCVEILCNMSHNVNPKAIGGMNSHNRVVDAGGGGCVCMGGAVVSGRQRTALCSQTSLLPFCGV